MPDCQLRNSHRRSTLHPGHSEQNGGTAITQRGEGLRTDQNRPGRDVGGTHDGARERQALRLVRVEQLGRCLAVDHAGELPGEVLRVLDADVHSLASHRAVHVRRVPDQEGPADAQLAREATMNAEFRDPHRIADFEVSRTTPAGKPLDVFDRRSGAIDGDRILARHGQDQSAQTTDHRDCSEDPVAEEDLQLVRRLLPVDARVREPEAVLVGGPTEGDSERLAHRAVGPIAADDPGRARALLASIVVTERRARAGAVLRETDQFDLPLNLDAVAAQQRVQDPLGLALCER